MAKKKPKKGKGKARVAARPKRQAPDLDVLRKPVVTAKGGLTKAEAEAKELIEKGQALVAQSRNAYREAVAAYREACRKLGVPCEFPGECSENVNPEISIETIERAEDGLTLVIKGRLETKD